MNRFVVGALVAGLAASTLAHPQGRQHRLIRHPVSMIRVESTRVKARIVDGVADTTVAIRLRNDGGRQGEKILLFPLPKGATADKLEMTVGGKLQAGEVLDKNKARGIYESIVRRRRDPALLEYLGRDVLRLRVFPIPPRGTQDVRVRFRMLLPEGGGLHTYEFPTRAVEAGGFSMDITIESTKAIKNVYSPIAGIDVTRKDDYHARASYECKGRPQRDPILFYGLSDRDFGLNLLTYRKGGKDGYYLLMLAPKRDWKSEKQLKKTITFVLDTSGSMQGKKIEQAKNALKFFLRSLRPSDAFNVVPFSTEARPFANGPVRANPDKIDEALKFADALEARGGTNIDEALQVALRAQPAESTVPMVVFLTDGLPTVGQTDPKQILKGCAARNGSHARIFVFGVGNDVNTYLLDKLSGDSGGTRDYVRPDENLEVKVSALFEKLAHPVMTDLEIVTDRVTLSRIVPRRLPDLFRGSRLVVAGRYKGDGSVALRLKGKVSGESKEFVYDASFPVTATDNDFVATLWAQRRVGQLLDSIRLNGRNKELIAEIQRLGRDHGIVTPYTSHIIVEEGARVARNFGRGRRHALPAGPSTPGAGGAADRVREELRRAGLVKRDKGELEGKDQAGYAKAAKKRLGELGQQATGGLAVADSKAASRLFFLRKLDGASRAKLWTSQRVDGRIFHLVGGVWIDGKYQAAMEKTLQKIEAFSDAYFELLKQRPKLAKTLAFSTAIVIVLDGNTAIEITPPVVAKK